MECFFVRRTTVIAGEGRERIKGMMVLQVIEEDEEKASARTPGAIWKRALSQKCALERSDPHDECPTAIYILPLQICAGNKLGRCKAKACLPQSSRAISVQSMHACLSLLAGQPGLDRQASREIHLQTSQGWVACVRG